MKTFRRQLFIKDLFSTRGLLNSFERIQFATVRDFFDSIEKRWLEIGFNKNIIIKVNDEDVDSFKKILESTKILRTDKVALDISNLSSFSLAPMEENLALRINLDNIGSLEEIQAFLKGIDPKWYFSNPIIIDVFINKDNYQNQLSCISELNMNTDLRIFEIHLDYESLSDLTFKEFEDLKFRLTDLINWEMPFRGSQSAVMSFLFSSLYKNVYVDDAKLYINEYARKDDAELFDMASVSILTTGEDIDAKELSTLRAYIDLKEYELSSFSQVNNIKRKSLIDPYFNKKLTSAYTLLPPITAQIYILF